MRDPTAELKELYSTRSSSVDFPQDVSRHFSSVFASDEAFKEVDMKNVPVVVRIRGTNEEVGQKTIAESGLGLDAFDKFEDAAKRVIEIANGSS